MAKIKTIPIDDETRGILANHLRIQTGLVQITRQLDRPLYDKVNKVLVAMGGKWIPKKAGHVFKHDRDIATELAELLSGAKPLVDEKKTFQIFSTPLPVADDMCRLADLKKGESVLEPSAGEGAIAEIARAYGANVICVEIRPEAVELLRKKHFYTVEADFVALDPLKLPQFDVVLMNPPFADGQELTHVRYAADRFLSPGGRLVSVMSNGAQFRSDRKYNTFRDWLNANGHEWELIELPRGTFAESGTGVNTCLLSWRKAG